MKDNLDNIKYIGYCWAKLPLDADETTFDDFVQYAKFQLCSKVNKLMKDPIWEEYTPEEILIEYYALLFNINDELAKKFVAKINGVIADDYNWILEQSKQEEAQMGNEEDTVSFSPDSLGE